MTVTLTIITGKICIKDLPMWGGNGEELTRKRFIDIRYSSENVPEALMLVKPMEDIERGKTLGIIGITISFKAIREILTNIVLDGEQLIVYNKSGVPVYSCSGKMWKNRKILRVKFGNA